MSEYWKSTPKYWCKHCKTHVRDTPLERRNHESTPRHQGNLSRFLRDLHRTNEREARDAQRAKDEAARLNGTSGSVAGGVSVAGGPLPSRSSGAGQARATPEERKRQLAQLAAMGVAVPDEYRRENAMAGEWESVVAKPAMPLGARKPLGQKVEIKSEGDIKKEGELSGLGVANTTEDERKRPLEEEDEGIGFTFKAKKKPKWGTDVKAYKGGDDGELDALLKSTTTVRKEAKTEQAPESTGAGQKSRDDSAETSVKNEDGEVAKVTDIPVVADPETAQTSPTTQLQADDVDVGSIFKKRKSKLKR